MNVTDEMVKLAVDKFLAAPNRNIGEIDDTMRCVLGKVLDRIDPVTLALASLGRTEKEVARHLRNAGIRGKRQHMHEDPIATWLARAGFTRPALFINPDGSGITVNADGWVDIPAPAAVVAFLRSFDMGAYHDLAEETN